MIPSLTQEFVTRAEAMGQTSLVDAHCGARLAAAGRLGVVERADRNEAPLSPL